MVGSYAVGDIWALVPARKAVWSLPGKPKATGKNFLPSDLFYALFILYCLFMPFLHIYFPYLFYISYITIYSSV